MAVTRLCTHVAAAAAGNGPRSDERVHRDECTQCFRSDEEGLWLCLTCYNGGCEDHATRHAALSGHNAAIRIVKRIAIQNCNEDITRPAKVTKLAIGVKGGFEIPDSPTYEYETKFKCMTCPDAQEIESKNDDRLKNLADKILATRSASQQQSIEAWEEQRLPCEHTHALVQDPHSFNLEARSIAHCSKCDLQSNLWLCMTCGALGCGRPIFGGGGGNGHGLEHFQETNHPVVCKMGTITPEGEADIFCYFCDDMKLDDHLKQHLQHFGIAMSSQEKTDKSMSELELEQNLYHEWSQVMEKGQALELLWGPGHTVMVYWCSTLINIGNSCYLSSVMQVLMSLDQFRELYFTQGREHFSSCPNIQPASCFGCQMAKLADGLWSGNYSKRPASLDDPGGTDEKVKQPGISPRMFKNLIARDHAEFKSTRQQDALEFWQFILAEIQKGERARGGADPSRMLEFDLEQRLQCTSCSRVRYTRQKTTEISIPLADASLPPQLSSGASDNVEWPSLNFEHCIGAWASPESIEGYNCPQCNASTTAVRTVRFGTFPDVLLVHVRRFVCPDWIPIKLGTNVVISEGPIDFAHLVGNGLLPDEIKMPDETASCLPSSLFQPNPDLMVQLTSMGFGENACIRALQAVDNADAEQAMNWLFGHLEDPDINLPLPDHSPLVSGDSAPDPGAIASLVAMGFAEDRCTFALQQTDGNAERAIDWLFSHADEPLPSTNSVSDIEMRIDDDANRAKSYKLIATITHLGQSTGFGHYVAHVWRPDEAQWVYFNDSKVAASPDPPLSKGYLYVLKRME